MKLKNVLKKYKSVCWYPSAGDDYRGLMFLSPEYASKNGWNEEKFPDCFIFTDCSNNQYTKSYRPFASNIGGSVELFNDRHTKVTADNIRELDSIDLSFHKEFVSDNKDGNYGRVFAATVTAVSDSLGTITRDLYYVVAEDINFGEDYLIGNNITTDYIICEKYDNYAVMALGNMLGRLKVRYFLSRHRYDDIIDIGTRKRNRMPDNMPVPEMEEVHRAIRGFWSWGRNVVWYRINGIPTGFKDLDNLMDGLHPSDLTVIAGRPAIGKTTLLLNMALNIALRGDGPVAIFSLGMSNTQIIERLVGMQSASDKQILEAIDNSQLIIDDTPSISTGELCIRCCKLLHEQDVRMIFIDDFKFIDSKTELRVIPDHIRLSYVSGMLKLLAEKLNVPVIVTSPISRDPEFRNDHRPTKQDLRNYCTGIEMDADAILFVYRDAYYDMYSDNNIAEIIVAKNRRGPIGTIFQKVRLAFVDSSGTANGTE